MNTQPQSAPRKSILIVDDSVAARRMILFALSSDPLLAVYEAAGLEEAMTILASRPIDLVITDYHMPGGDGIELTRCLRALFPVEELPVLMLSADLSPELREQARNLGATGWIDKPFKPSQILDLVRNLLL